MGRTGLTCWRMTTILSIMTTTMILILNSHTASAMEDVINDHFLGLNPRSGSRFLAENVVKKGDQCFPGENNICNGLSAKDGQQLLYCCKNNCRNVLSDRNNCGVCGNKCAFGELCCNGSRTMVAYDVNNCGRCGFKCKTGARCEYGSCGYA